MFNIFSIVLFATLLFLLFIRYFNSKYLIKVEVLDKWRFDILYTTFPIQEQLDHDYHNLTIGWFGKYYIYRLKARYFNPRTQFTESRWSGVSFSRMGAATVSLYWKGKFVIIDLPWKRVLLDSGIPMLAGNRPFHDYSNNVTVSSSYVVTKSIWCRKWLKWIPLIKHTTRTIIVAYRQEVGHEKGTFKGGDLGYTGMMYEHETVGDTYTRLENRYKPASVT